MSPTTWMTTKVVVLRSSKATTTTTKPRHPPPRHHHGRESKARDGARPSALRGDDPETNKCPRAETTRRDYSVMRERGGENWGERGVRKGLLSRTGYSCPLIPSIHLGDLGPLGRTYALCGSAPPSLEAPEHAPCPAPPEPSRIRGTF